MFEILKESTGTCLVAHFSGKVTGQEYQHFLDAVEERLKAADRIDLVLELAGLDFYGDWEAFKKDLKFGFGEFKKVRRAALVGDQKWIEWWTHLGGPLTSAEEKHFPEGQLAAACEWACAR